MRLKIFSAILTGVIVAASTPLHGQANHAAKSKENMVVSVNPLATEAGINAFKQGGNAIDAAIATALTLGVVDGYNSGIGGGCFILIRRHDGQFVAIDGREMAPAAASRDMFMKNGKPIENASQIGPLAIGVPGALKAYQYASSQFGKLDLKRLILPAASLAERGFEISAVYSSVLQSEREYIQRFPGAAAILLKPDGSIFAPNERLQQIDLANSYRAIANQGIAWFYGGEFAKKTQRWMQENNGLLTKADFENYALKIREPVRTTYREFEIIGFPPPSSGGVHVAQILNMLETFDLAAIHNEDPAKLKHLVAEAMKLAFADRAYWLGDPDFVDVPKRLVSKSYARQLAKRIDLSRTISVDSHGVPPASESEFFERHTTHLATADAAGNWVAITTTVNTRFGSKVIVPGLGVVMNSQMDDFSVAPGIPNVYGLVGSEHNSIAPAKRPLSSMSPTIILKDGHPVFSVGAAGGPMIISQAVWAIVNRLDLQMSVPTAIASARVHHQWSPDTLLVERTLDRETVEKLRLLGHQIKVADQVGISQAIGFDPVRREFTGAHDPRIPGKAMGQ